MGVGKIVEFMKCDNKVSFDNSRGNGVILRSISVKHIYVIEE